MTSYVIKLHKIICNINFLYNISNELYLIFYWNIKSHSLFFMLFYYIINKIQAHDASIYTMCLKYLHKSTYTLGIIDSS